MALPQRYIEKDHYTEEEYLRWEEDAPYKSEYVRGEIRAMAGGTEVHGAITINVAAELRAALRGRGCRTLSFDVKVRTPSGSFRYPDVTVVCGESRYHGRGRSVILNPILVVEVLSGRTAATDWGEKLVEYQAIESLQAYLIVDQNSPLLALYTRLENGHWEHQTVTGLENTLTLPTVGVSLALAEVYDQITFRPRLISQPDPDED